jgi:hypothetical protein
MGRHHSYGYGFEIVDFDMEQDLQVVMLPVCRQSTLERFQSCWIEDKFGGGERTVLSETGYAEQRRGIVLL